MSEWLNPDQVGGHWEEGARLQAELGQIVSGKVENPMPGAIKARRGHRSLREVAEEIGVSASTLSRIENGSVPELDSYVKISAWLNQGDELRDYRIEIRATGIVRAASSQEAKRK